MVAESDGSSEREDMSLLYSFGASDYYLCVSKSRPDLLAALSRAQEQMLVDEPNFVSSLKIKYDIVSRKLSGAEKHGSRNMIRSGSAISTIISRIAILTPKATPLVLSATSFRRFWRNWGFCVLMFPTPAITAMTT